MKPLPRTFNQNGFDFVLQKREGRIALFEKTKIRRSPNYEVVEIQSHDGFPIPGTDKRSEPAEYMPSSNEWGSKGWTFRSLEAAFAKFNALVAREKAKISTQQTRQSDFELQIDSK